MLQRFLDQLAVPKCRLWSIPGQNARCRHQGRIFQQRIIALHCEWNAISKMTLEPLQCLPAREKVVTLHIDTVVIFDCDPLHRSKTVYLLLLRHNERIFISHRLAIYLASEPNKLLNMNYLS